MAKKKKRKTKSKTVKRVSKSELQERQSFAKVIGTIVAIFIAIFVALSNFSLCGYIGSIVRSIVLSLFGTLGYFLPILIVLSILITSFNSKSKSNIKIYALIILYISIICLFESKIHDYSDASDLFDTVNISIKNASGLFSFGESNFSGGVLGTAITYISNKAIGQIGSYILFGTIGLITFILLVGLGISKDIVNIFKSIIFFIPNAINYYNTKKEEDRRIEIDNENILNSTINKSKMLNYQADYNNDLNDGKITLSPLENKKKDSFDTSNITITPDEIQSRFYDVKNDSKVSSEQKHLLREMKKKSINEIIYEQNEKGIKDSSFFYTDKVKPIEELENITIPNTSHIDVVPNNDNNTQSYSDDENDFAYGLEKLNNENNKTETAKEFLTDIKNKDLEFTNNSIKDETVPKSRKRIKQYKFPPISFLNKSGKLSNTKDPKLNEKSNLLVETLKQFGVGVTVTDITVGPSITRFELKPDIGVKISKILSLENDIKLALAASEIRIEAPIPGKAAIGIEVANDKSSGVLLGDIINTSEFKNAKSKLTVAIGKDISGKAIITDLRKMPHLLIAGATGSGKSVCVNSLITSLIYKASPDDVRLIMVDPKIVELQIYNGIPHLLIPVVTNPKKAAGALNWAVSEMTRRYNLIQEKKVRDIESYNQAIEGEINKIGVNEDNEANIETTKKMPYIVIIIDEFADLMMVASKEVENSIMRIAQLARACGIYLVIATQRPTVNVISGSIKTNVPSRISFAVSSGIDSQTILDRRGAEKLLGHGDMLYFPTGIPEPIRVQGCYVSEDEILNVVNYIRDDNAVYDEKAESIIEKSATFDDNGSNYDSNDKDEMFLEAGRLIIDQQNASIGMLQRRFRMGFNRAARIIDQLEAENVISAQNGKKPREILMTAEEFENKFGG